MTPSPLPPDPDPIVVIDAAGRPRDILDVSVGELLDLTTDSGIAEAAIAIAAAEQEQKTNEGLVDQVARLIDQADPCGALFSGSTNGDDYGPPGQGSTPGLGEKHLGHGDGDLGGEA